MTIFRDVTVYRGDGEPSCDVKLGHLRDMYDGADDGTLSPEAPDNVIPLRKR